LKNENEINLKDKKNPMSPDVINILPIKNIGKEKIIKN